MQQITKILKNLIILISNFLQISNLIKKAIHLSHSTNQKITKQTKNSHTNTKFLTRPSNILQPQQNKLTDFPRANMEAELKAMDIIAHF